MITEVYAYEEAPASYGASIFLVGPTPREDDVQSWRPSALKTITSSCKNQEIDLVIFVPEARDRVYRYFEQVEWEKRYLEMADAILAWVPRDMNTTMKGLTTNVEFGRYVESGKLFYGRPDNADEIRYLDWIYTNFTGRKANNTLSALTQEVLTYLQTKLALCDHKVRREGERFIPLNIWSTLQFQNWYQSQRQAGNKLVDARLLWTFMIHRVNLTFAYVLHTHVWIAAENRIKRNEFIISRPDISVVVPYWKHPTVLVESEIVLIKEFRTPARTADGFVHELPGGSSFQGGDPLQIARHECCEETSLQIDVDRFRYLGSKQLVATWSTHYAHVYAVALEKPEIDHAKELARSGNTFGIGEDTEKTYVEVCQLKDVGRYVDWAMEGMIYRAVFWNE